MPLKFIDAIAEHAGVTPNLPFVHTTSAPAFEYDIEPEGMLKKQPCKVYNDDLIYLFYGKPSYRPRGSQTSYHADMMQFAPVCLLIDVPRDVIPKRIMPFDSGAYHNGIMANEGHAHFRLRKELFEIKDPVSPGVVVNAFFGTNQLYYDERPILPPTIDPRKNTCVETYVSLISRTGTNDGDSRLNTIEAQFDKDIHLGAAGTVLAVAMAEPFYQQRPEIRCALSKWGAEPLLYPLSGRFTSGECCYTIDRMVRSYLIDKGLL